MSLLRAIIADLREKRLWLAAAVLLAALIAVPLLVSKGPTTARSEPPPQARSASTGGVAAAPAVQASTSAGSLGGGGLSGAARDPFAQRSSGHASVAATAPPSTTGEGAGGTPSATASTPSGGTQASGATPAGEAGGGSASGSEASPPTLPPVKRPLAPQGLTPTESYRVAFAITNASGGFGTIDPLERLSPVPSAQQPLLIELGVLNGGQRVLFALLGGATVAGPGLCIPGRVNCELVSLAPGQVETLSRTSAGSSQRVAYFAVSGIGIDRHRTAAAAMRARLSVSAAGQRLLGAANLPALSLFRYEPDLGSLVDLRNLVIGDES